jgi:anti-anti-sigma factor
MDIKQRFEKGCAILSLHGNALSDPDISGLKHIVSSHLNAGVRHIVLDLRQVNYINSSGLGGLLHIRKVLEDVKGTVTLTEVNKNIHDILKRTALEKIFRISPSIAEALKI